MTKTMKSTMREWVVPAGILVAWMAATAAVLMAFAGLPAAEQDWRPVLVAEEIVIHSSPTAASSSDSATVTCEAPGATLEDCTL